MFVPDYTKMPSECGPIYFNGNTAMFQVPDLCCTAEAGALDWMPFKDFGSQDGIDGCKLVPFEAKQQNVTVFLVNGCYDDGTQFYGEKCGGTDFGVYHEDAYGDCGPLSPKQGKCSCNLYVETKSPGCFAIASPESPGTQVAVFMKAEGCEKP